MAKAKRMDLCIFCDCAPCECEQPSKPKKTSSPKKVDNVADTKADKQLLSQADRGAIPEVRPEASGRVGRAERHGQPVRRVSTPIAAPDPFSTVRKNQPPQPGSRRNDSREPRARHEITRTQDEILTVRAGEFLATQGLLAPGELEALGPKLSPREKALAWKVMTSAN